MSDIINDYVKQFYPQPLDESKFEFTTMLGGMRRYRDYSVETVFPRLKCADGFSVSVQGHSGSYSHPRDDFAEHYTAFELGFPSATDDLIAQYAEDSDNPTDTVYGYVPVAVVVALIEKHGGIVGHGFDEEQKP